MLTDIIDDDDFLTILYMKDKKDRFQRFLYPSYKGYRLKLRVFETQFSGDNKER